MLAAAVVAGGVVVGAAVGADEPQFGAVVTVLGALLAAVAALCGLGFGRYAWPAARRSDTAGLLAQQIEAARLTEECRALRSRVGELENAHQAAAVEAKTAAIEVARLKERESALSEAGR